LLVYPRTGDYLQTLRKEMLETERSGEGCSFSEFLAEVDGQIRDFLVGHPFGSETVFGDRSLAELFGFTGVNSLPSTESLEQEAPVALESGELSVPNNNRDGFQRHRETADEMWLLSPPNRRALPTRTSLVEAIRGLTRQRVWETARAGAMVASAEKFVATYEEWNLRLVRSGFSFLDPV
jgi:hypothetical protein